MWWRRLLKWSLVVLAALAVALLVVVWAVLGVNPVEGRVDHLWDLVSHEVHVFIRFPGARVLEEDVVEELAAREGYYALADLKDRLAEMAVRVEERVNPEIPLGLLEMDLKQDLFRNEMALAGRITDFAHPRFDYFLALARVPFYGRFVSALKRSFVSSKIQGANIEVVKGLYLRVRLGPESVAQLEPYRSVMARPEGDDVIFVGRIKDVVVVSDNDVWIEHALMKTGYTLPADAWFESEFIDAARGGRAIEAYFNQEASQSFVARHARSTLRPLTGILPPRVMGEVTVRARTHGADLVTVDATNRPPEESLARSPEYLRKIYESEKTDPSYDLSDDGIGKFIPRERTVAAMVLRAAPEDLVGLIVQQLLPADQRELDEMVRRNARTRFGYISFERMLARFAGDMGQTHLVVFHRPSVFDRVDYTRLYDPPDKEELTPMPQLGFTAVLQVKDNVSPEEFRDTITKHLPILEMTKIDENADDGMQFAKLEVQPEMLSLVEPTYGAMPEGMRYVYISTSREGARAVLRAARDPDARLLADERVAAMRAELPRKDATMAFVARGDGLKRHLLDFVRLHVEETFDVHSAAAAIRREYQQQRKPVPSDRKIIEMARAQAAEEYPLRKERYDRSLKWLDPIDVVMGTCTLGVGTHRRAEVSLSISFDFAR